MRSPSTRPSGVPPERAILIDRGAERRRFRQHSARPARARTSSTAVDRTLAQLAVAEIDAGQPCRRRELDELRVCGRRLAARTLYFSCTSVTIERPSAVSSASTRQQAASAASRSVTPGTGINSVACRLPKRDRAGLVEQQRIDVAGGFDGTARHREHIEAHQPVHAGDADGRQQARRWWSGSA